MSYTKRINPVAFELDREGRPHFRYEMGSQLFAGRPGHGKYLRLSIRHLKYKHDGRCSDYAFSTDPETDKQYVDRLKRTDEKKLVIYLHFPKYLCHGSGMNLHSRFIGADDCLQECEETEQFFYEWYEDSNCEGSARCGLHNVYIPIKYEIVIM